MAHQLPSSPAPSTARGRVLPGVRYQLVLRHHLEVTWKVRVTCLGDWGPPPQALPPHTRAGQVTAPSRSRDPGLPPAMSQSPSPWSYPPPGSLLGQWGASCYSPEGESVAVSLVTFARNSIPPLISSAPRSGASSGSESSKSGGKGGTTQGKWVGNADDLGPLPLTNDLDRSQCPCGMSAPHPDKQGSSPRGKGVPTGTAPRTGPQPTSGDERLLWPQWVPLS